MTKNTRLAAIAGMGVQPAATLRKLARRVVPYAWRHQHHQRREEALVSGWYRDWMVIRDTSKLAPELSRDCLLIPSDTRTFSGGKGDEAMTAATIEALRGAGHDGRIHALCETGAASAAARRLGCEPFTIAQDNAYVRNFQAWLEGHRPCVAVGIGADSIDGAYGVVGPAGLLADLDMAAALGSRAFVTGFSIRAEPARALASFFSTLRPEVRLNVRDPLSLDRLRTAYDRKGTLVADTAFLLKPQNSPRVEVLERWIDERRAAGRAVLALNVHPMLFPAGDGNSREALLDALSSAVLQISRLRPIAIALVAHDFRPGDADAILLNPLAERLSALGEDLRADYSAELSASELKAASALFDGVISARMHFAIASLGSGTPVLGIAYQGKFEGLIDLFELPRWLLLGPRSSETDIITALERFLEELPVLRTHVEKQKKRILTLAAANFETL